VQQGFQQKFWFVRFEVFQNWLYQCHWRDDGYFPGTVCDGKKIRLGKLAVCVELWVRNLFVADLLKVISARLDLTARPSNSIFGKSGSLRLLCGNSRKRHNDSADLHRFAGATLDFFLNALGISRRLSRRRERAVNSSSDEKSMSRTMSVTFSMDVMNITKKL